VVSLAAETDRSFRHEGLLYGGDQSFLDGTVPFVQDGLAAGEEVLVVVERRKIALLEAALGDDSALVGFADMAAVGQNPARIIPLWRNFADSATAAGRAFRGIGEPVWPGRTAAQLSECHRHEALLNVAFAGAGPFALLCPYDAGALDPAVVEAAHATHPTMASSKGRYSSHAYRGLDAIVAPFDEPLPEPETGVSPSGLVFQQSSLSGVRALVRRFATDAGLDEERAGSVVLAVNEIATNSIRYGGGGGVLRLWTEPRTLVCEVRDDGHITEPLAGRQLPPADQAGGRGLWMANQLCDLVQVRSSAAGTTVRLHLVLAG
jgi:anti-sigma regulatory factor (Ser/Thr protein kinase)